MGRQQRRKVEPNADFRIAARTMFEMFTALVDEGFTEGQALVIVGQMIANSEEEEQ